MSVIQRSIFRVCTVAFLFFLGKLAVAGAPAGRPEVTGAMRQNFDAIMKLLPYIASPRKFENPKNHAFIGQQIDVLARMKHTFPKPMAKEEPGVAGIALLFTDYIGDMQRGFRRGNLEYARAGLATITGFCFQCHTRMPPAHNFEDWEKKVESAKLSPFEKADLFAVTRQFDKSLAAYRSAFEATPKSEMDWITYSKAARNALSVLVRVKHDASATVTFLNEISKGKELPEYLKREFIDWRADADYWVQEEAKSGANKDLSGEKKVELARKLLERAGQLQTFPTDERAEISYLRASNYLHEALEASPKAAYRGEALYLLGMTYRALSEPPLWQLDGMYFEECVREFPHTDIGRKCYQAYARRIFLGYTGSGGTFIPEDEVEKMQELGKLIK